MNNTVCSIFEPDSHPFWDFSLALYANKEVEIICLALQDDYSANVNILLFCCWFAESGRGLLNKNDMHMIQCSINAWHLGITVELRRMRRRLSKKNLPSWARELRRHVLDDELAAEKAEQFMLATSIEKSHPAETKTYDQLTYASQNLRTYFTVLGVTLDKRGEGLLQRLLFAAFSMEDDGGMSEQLSLFSNTQAH